MTERIRTWLFMILILAQGMGISVGLFQDDERLIDSAILTVTPAFVVWTYVANRAEIAATTRGSTPAKPPS